MSDSQCTGEMPVVMMGIFMLWHPQVFHTQMTGLDAFQELQCQKNKIQHNQYSAYLNTFKLKIKINTFNEKILNKKSGKVKKNKNNLHTAVHFILSNYQVYYIQNYFL